MADEWELLHRRCPGLTRAVGGCLHILRETLKSQKFVIVLHHCHVKEGINYLAYEFPSFVYIAKNLL